MLARVFAEISRVLRPDGKATVVFHAAKAVVWRALMQAYTDAGFGVTLSSVLNKLQDSFKQVISTVSVKGDPLLLLERVANQSPSAAVLSEDESLRIIDELIRRSAESSEEVGEQSVERLYSRYVSRCLEMGMGVSMNADTFYAECRALAVAR
jgi:hypothetical protein